MFFLYLQSAVVLAAAYVGWRIPATLHLRGRARRFALFAVLLFVAFVVGVPLAWRSSGRDVSEPQPLLFAAYAGMGLLAILVALTLAGDLVLLATWALARLRAKRGAAFDPDRRAFLARGVGAGALGVSGAAAGFGVFVAHRGPEVVDVDVPIRGLPAALEGLRIAQVSDVHVGPSIRSGFVHEIVRRVNALQPDLIALTGDFVDGGVDALRAHTAPLAGLKARFGAYFVTGNHEYHSDPDGWVAEMRRLGIRVLENEHHVIEHGGARLLVAGVHDLRAGRKDPTKACDPARCLEGAPPVDAKILLAHQPMTVRLAAGLGYDLQLSGHTHGGQLFPFNFLIHFAQPLVAGLYDVDGTKVYVNSGTGYWGPPMRIGPPSEITQLTLRRA